MYISKLIRSCVRLCANITEFMSEPAVPCDSHSASPLFLSFFFNNDGDNHP